MARTHPRDGLQYVRPRAKRHWTGAVLPKHSLRPPDGHARKERRAGERNETVLIFTSDNGYLLGEHRLRAKGLPYEEAAAVPLLMRGPGIPRGRRRTQVVGNVDLAPTILDLAGGRRAGMDGRTLLPLIRNRNKAKGRGVLIEVLRGSGYRPVRALRTRKYAFIDHRGSAAELYNMRRDPYQLASRYKQRPYRRAGRRLRSRVKVLAHCRRTRCR
jgi:N-acetylglucosamine-6-sulfatase